jgi:hypothetical protein
MYSYPDLIKYSVAYIIYVAAGVVCITLNIILLRKNFGSKFFF